ncbi:MAG: ATP-binding protein [Anaerolineae bacterium]|nr:ATP-binding protein [Anaerolineae bacterium]
MIQSLATRLTLAFLTIGVLGALLVAVVSNIQVRSRFNKFIFEQDSNSLANQLADYYIVEGDWDEVAQFFAGLPERSLPGPWVVLVDSAENEIIRWPPNSVFMPDQPTDRSLVVVDGVTVATLIHEPPPDRNLPDGLPREETNFLRDVTIASFISAGVAIVFALVAGVWLARRMMRPINALTDATQAMAAGKLGTQVPVESRDEIGRLARSFNKMSRDLAEANHLRTQMTADIAHDLRTPLTVLQGYLEGLKDGELAGSPRLYAVLYEEAQQLSHLVHELRTLSLADAGELPLHKQPIDPKALLERSGLAYVMQAEQQGVVLHIEAADDLPAIMVDLERMTQVLNNLVSNALRHTPTGEITLAAHVAGEKMVLQVRDTGVGIDSADLPYIFDRFYRADKSRSRQEYEAGSSGLGLAIARAIVLAHGGEISAEAQPGNGTTINIALPLR